jgi:putative transposase
VLTGHGCSIAPSTFYDALSRRPSRRQLRDEQLMQIITDERESNRFVAGLGARKMWLRRAARATTSPAAPSND